jgi:hypothetical protein
MKIIPRQTETVISPLQPSEINRRLDGLTASPSLRSNRTEEDKLFQGRVHNRSFVLSRKISHPNNFIPLVNGRIESTSKGSIIFIKYSLFKSSLLFLSFAIGIAFIIGLLFILLDLPELYSITAFALGLANYLVTLLNFNRQVRMTHEALLEALNIDEEDINDPAYFS